MSAGFQRAKSSRLICLAVCFGVMATLLVARLVYWQVLRRDDVFENTVADEAGIGAMALRGTIYDCHGHYLAIPSIVYDVGASPQMIPNKEEAAGLLAPLLGVPEEQLLAELSDESAQYVPLARGLPIDKGRAIKDLGLLGLKFDLYPGRFYPEGSLASTVLGFVNSERQGYYGIEEQYDEQLRGSDGSQIAGGPKVLFDLPMMQTPRDGLDLVLTIDRVVQRAAEEHLQAALEEYEAPSGCIIVMEPHTGAILALAVAPSYDPNNYGDVSSIENYVNAAISEQYEPGSVFKVVTMATALNDGVVRPEDTYYDSGQAIVGGSVFQNWDRMAHGVTTMTGILAHSLNVGSIYVAQQLGSTRFYDGVRSFGFGKPTGIDLAGEVSGLVRYPGAPDWYAADLAANSFGQGLAVTPLQMIDAVAAVANDGVLMKPYVVDRIVQDGKTIWQAEPKQIRRVITSDAAKTLTGMLTEALPEETALGVVPHYTAAGKTGTAQLVENGSYAEEDIIASFVGFLPADDPRFVVLVKLDDPKKAAWGSQSAAPVWRDLAGELCAYMGIPPDGARIAGR